MVNGAGELLFFRQREGPWMPTLRLLHKCKNFVSDDLRMFIKILILPVPFFLPLEQVDKGAIRFVLSGANIMCPGLTSKGAKMTTVDKGTVVVSFLTNYIILLDNRLARKMQNIKEITEILSFKEKVSML